MNERQIRPLHQDDFAELMRLEEEVFGASGEAVLGAYYVRLCCAGARGPRRGGAAPWRWGSRLKAPAPVQGRLGAVATVLASGTVSFVVGGDHSVALPALRAVGRWHGPVAVVHVDAHLDTSGPETWGEPFHHGTPFRHALEEGLIATGQLHQVGVRGPWASARDAEPGAAHGARVHTMEDVAERGIAAIAAEIRHAVGDRPVYLSFDVDAVDPAFAPGTGTPVPGGLTSREALQLVRDLAGVALVGMDVVEVCPPLDHADVTSHLAAHLLFEGLALAALAVPGTARGGEVTGSP